MEPSEPGSNEKHKKKSRNSENPTTTANQAESIRNGIRSTRKRLSININPQANNEKEITHQRRKVPTNSSRKSHLPRSVSEAVLAQKEQLHSNDLNAKKKKRDQMGVDVTDRVMNKRTKKVTPKKKKTRALNFTSGEEDNYNGDEEFSDVFHIDNEDIIKAKDMDQSIKNFPNVILPPSQPSQPRNVFYVEKKDGQGFTKEHKPIAKFNQQDFTINLFEESRELTPLEFVLRVHRAFKSFAVLCHGLLAGLATSQCVFVFTLSAAGEKSLLDYYQRLAIPFQSIFYFLFTVCAVSVLDRYANLNNGWHQFFLGLLSKPSRALGLVVYFISLAFSVSLAQLDDRIGLYKELPALWSGGGSRLQTWKAINLLRVIGSVLGWVIVGINLGDDQTEVTITRTIEEETFQENST